MQSIAFQSPLIDNKNMTQKTDPNWWRGAVIYQVYPRSYKDTNGDGVGDLKGITGKLDYIASLGVEGIWISPFFKSPMKDFGYDVSDYRQIDPLFGTMSDFKTLLDEAHRQDLKIIVDMVLSHTSDQHVWFQQSKQDQTNPKADWYVWADAKPDGSPPNNWISVFGGSAWTFDVFRGQYYLHNFLKEQPDLNYHNPDVMAAMLDECRFWLDMGVDGFRLDAVNYCTHDKELRDNPARQTEGQATQLEFRDTYNMQDHVYDKSRPENLDFMRKIRTLTNEYEGTFIVAEIGCDDEVKTSQDYTATPDLLHTAYSFAFMGNAGEMPPAELFKDIIMTQIGENGQSWPSWAFSNHDVVRAASRWSGNTYSQHPALSKMLIALVTTLRGTAFLYQGEELGLPEAHIPYEKLQDPWGKYLYPKWQGRDGCRTPMPWNAQDKNAGFSDAAETWLPIPDTHLPLTVATQEENLNSTLHFTRKFLNWRNNHAALKDGDITFLDDLPTHILGFTRNKGDENILCLFNLKNTEQEIPTPSHDTILYGAADITSDTLTLPPYGYVFLST